MLGSSYSKIQMLRQSFVCACGIASPVQFHISHARAVIYDVNIASRAIATDAEVHVRNLASVQIPEGADYTALAGGMERKDRIHAAADVEAIGRLLWLQGLAIYSNGHLRATDVLLSRRGRASRRR